MTDPYPLPQETPAIPSAPAQTSDAPPEFLPLDGAAAAGPRQIVLVPGEEVPLFALDLPAGLRGLAREQVARRQLAGLLGAAAAGDGLELRPFAPAAAKARSQTPGAWTRVLAADAAWLAGLQALPGRAVLPDYLSLPAAEGVWTLAAAPDSRILARLGPADGFAAAAPLGEAMLKRALETGPAPRALLLQAPLPALRALAQERDIPVADSPAAVAALGLPQPQLLGHGELACDLRRNPMAARAQLAARVLPWRWPALAAALAAVLWSAGQLIAISRLEAETQRLAAETGALVQQQFTGGAPVLDARLQVSRALAELRGAAAGSGPDPLDMAARTAEAAAASGGQTERLGYRDGDGLTLVIRLPGFAAADALAAALGEAGLQAALTDSRTLSGAEGVRAEFAITAAEARP